MASGGCEDLVGRSREGGSKVWVKVWVDMEDIFVDDEGQVYVPVDLDVAREVFTKKKKAARAGTRTALRLVK